MSATCNVCATSEKRLYNPCTDVADMFFTRCVHFFRTSRDSNPYDFDGSNPRLLKFLHSLSILCRVELLDANAICALRFVDNKYAKNCEVRNFCALRKNLHTLLFSSLALLSLQKRVKKGLRTTQKIEQCAKICMWSAVNNLSFHPFSLLRSAHFAKNHSNRKYGE